MIKICEDNLQGNVCIENDTASRMQALREAAKKRYFFGGLATMREGWGKGLATKKKERFLKLPFWKFCGH